MQEGKRQKQVAGILQEVLNDIFIRLELNMMHGGMLSIAEVKVTPDLLEARIYLSFFRIEDADAALKKVEARAWEIKKRLAEKIKHQVRNIPVLKFFKDNTLDEVFKMENILNKLNEDEK